MIVLGGLCFLEREEHLNGDSYRVYQVQEKVLFTDVKAPFMEEGGGITLPENPTVALGMQRGPPLVPAYRCPIKEGVGGIGNTVRPPGNTV
jgi:hypothetical protein